MDLNRSLKWILSLVLSLAITGSAATALGDKRVEIDVSSACLISPGNDSLSSRVLLRFDLPSELDDKRIDYAEVVFKAEVDTLSRYSVTFAGYPVTRGWIGAGLSWSSPWTNEGGDYNDSLYETGLVKTRGDGTVRFDITRLVTAWQQGSLANYGLIIIPVEEERRITQLVHPAEFPQGVFAKVTIYFSYTHP
jgi:hypothetical protein